MPHLVPATPLEIAQYGHIAALLRGYLDRTGFSVGDLNHKLGQPRGHTQTYKWLQAKGGPGPDNRKKLARIIGCQPDDLVARVRGRADAAVGTALAVIPPKPPAGSPRTPDVLAFTVTADGTARVRLDATLPLVTAMPLIRMLLDAGLVLTQ